MTSRRASESPTSPGGRALRAGVLLAMVSVCLAVGAVGALTTASSVDTWYEDIQKPGWTPPDGVFGPVWTLLYVMMGVSAWLVWDSSHAQGTQRRLALTFFAVQLALNALWSQLFFGLRSPALALIGITVLWVAILSTLLRFRRIRSAAGWMLAPYLAWVTFAMALNAAIWSLNRV